MLVESGQRYVAFFDLLGFRSWLEAEGSYTVFTYVRRFLNLMIRASLPGSIVHPDMSVTVKDESISFVNFSDSIIFYTYDDSERCLETILIVAGEFMNSVITGPSRMIRGAIAHGEFYADPTTNAYVGQALVDAYQLEGGQDWLSCSLDRTVELRPEFKSMLIKYPNFIVKALTPLKKSSQIPHCLNWADSKVFSHIYFNAEQGIDECERKGMLSIKDNFHEREKLNTRIANTRQFIRYYNRAEK